MSESVSQPARALKEVWDTAELIDELKLDLDGPGRYFWAGTEAGMLGAYGFQGIQAGGDGSGHLHTKDATMQIPTYLLMVGPDLSPVLLLIYPVCNHRFRYSWMITDGMFPNGSQVAGAVYTVP